MRFQIPPHIAWPGFVVLLLLFSVVTSVSTLFLSKADGGAQVVDAYYRQGSNWDSTAAVRAASAALGWKTAVVVEASSAQRGLRTVDVTVADRTGELVTGLRGTLRVSRPQRAEPVAELPLQPVLDAPGHYRQQVPLDASGLWDFEVVAARDTLRFVEKVRLEIAAR